MTQESTGDRYVNFFQQYNKEFFYNNTLNDILPLETTNITWKSDTFSPNIEYAWLTQNGLSLDECCPPHLKEEWISSASHIKSHIKSLKYCGVSPISFEILPSFVIFKHMNIINKIAEHTWKNKTIKNEHYRTLKAALEVILQCKKYNLNFDQKFIREKVYLKLVRDFASLISKRNVVEYKLFGTKTGRFSTSGRSFPVLNLDKKFKEMVVPNNDLFLVLDYNGAEARTLLALSGNPQPAGDIHAWTAKLAARGFTTRDEMKQRFFAWLYNPESEDHMLSRYYNKNIYKNFYNGGVVKTPFGREMRVEEKKALNYLIQSTTNDIVIESAQKINKKLASNKTCLAFLVHDSIILDVHKDDRDIIMDIIKEIEQTRFGSLKCNASLGKNYGDLRVIQ